MKLSFIVFCVFAGSLFVRDQRIPRFVLQAVAARYAPTNILVYVESASFGFVHGLRFRNLRVYDRTARGSLDPVASASVLELQPLRRRVFASGLTYLRLPEAYYAPGNSERNERVGVTLPDVSRFELILERPDILGVTPERVVADVDGTVTLSYRTIVGGKQSYTMQPALIVVVSRRHSGTVKFNEIID